MTMPVGARYAVEGQEVIFTMPPGKPLTGEKVEAETQRLRELVARAGLPATAEAMFAGYDPPMTLPFLRRVEVWLELG